MAARRSSRVKTKAPVTVEATVAAPRRRVKDRYFYAPPTTASSSSVEREVPATNRNVFLAQNFPDEVSSNNENQVFLAQNFSDGVSSTNENLDFWTALSRTNQDSPCSPNEVMKSFVDTNGDGVWAAPRSLIFGNTVRDDASCVMVGSPLGPVLVDPLPLNSPEDVTAGERFFCPYVRSGKF